MHPCLSWITLTMLTTAQATPPAGAVRVWYHARPRLHLDWPRTSPATSPRTTLHPPRLPRMPPRPSGGTANPSGDPEARAEQAANLYSERKYIEAAEILEDLWASVHEPRDLFNAALARIAAGHRAHAIRYWETYLLLPGVPADGREQALARLKKAQAAAVGVNLKVAPVAVAEVGVTYTLRRAAPDLKDSRPPVVVDLPVGAPEFSAGGRTVYLDPGKWELKVEARGYRTALHDLNIKPGQSGFPKDIVLGPDPMFRHASFQVEPPEAVSAGATVTLQRMTAAAQPVPCPLSSAGACALKLEPGDWEVVVSAPGYQRYTEKVSLGAQPTASFAVALVPTVTVPPPDPVVRHHHRPPPPETPAPPAKPETVPRPVRLKLSTGLVASGIPVFIAGLALGVTGSNSYQDGRTMGNSAAELLPAVRMRSAGMGLVGAAVGLWATGLTAEYDVKPVVWYSELGVGGAFLLTGAVWSAVGTSRWNQNQVPKFHCANSEGIDCFASHRMASSFFLGAGAAMIVGSTLGILIQRKYLHKRRTVMSPYFAGSGAGFMLQGRF
jgi:hypothetical protein